MIEEVHEFLEPGCPDDVSPHDLWFEPGDPNFPWDAILGD